MSINIDPQQISDAILQGFSEGIKLGLSLLEEITFIDLNNPAEEIAIALLIVGTILAMIFKGIVKRNRTFY